MGRYSEYFQDIWKMQASRKVIGVSLFGVFFENSTPFTPGNQLKITEGVEKGIRQIVEKGYDFLIISGQPPLRTRNLEQQDFENILNATKEVVETMGGRIKNAYYTPSIDKNDPYVKPNTGMFDRAANEGQVKWDETFYIGAEINDVKAATKVKAKPILIKSGNAKTKAFELTHQIKLQEYDSLLDFANTL
jgi:HAD superfamily hydrolase (TIGR01662 family)